MCKCKNDKCIDCGSYYFGEQKKDETKMEILIWICAILMLIASVSLGAQAYSCEEDGGVFVGAMFDSKCVGVDE